VCGWRDSWGLAHCLVACCFGASGWVRGSGVSNCVSQQFWVHQQQIIGSKECVLKPSTGKGVVEGGALMEVVATAPSMAGRRGRGPQRADESWPAETQLPHVLGMDVCTCIAQFVSFRGVVLVRSSGNRAALRGLLAWGCIFFFASTDLCRKVRGQEERGC